MSAPNQWQDSEVLLAEQVGQDLARWQLPRFDVPAEPLPEPPTAEEIASIEEAAHQEGYAHGHKEGYEAGRLAGEKPLLEQAERLRQLIEHIAKPLQQLDDEVEQALTELAAAIAERVVADELSLQPERIRQMLRDVLKGLPSQLRTLRVQVHPEDAALLAAQFTPEQDVDEFSIVEDASLQRGDCRVSSDSSLIDGRWKTRLAEVVQAIGGERG
ncbi:FliH/SctL family protein [Sinimarinibacterium sp. NLF-5-8]|uniref:FliH/SctL family protein n=1 Tax=Sinimarinibacterium sp. NLF-5-8 TaxID=2698684 RepID=UPI00137BA2D4|nr:FliH/SctL family protein [Sinimarinibacterium sp. NLF-5-8]QHS09242.1 hypothetical protein GT972_03110 [Sinimarinibacterium sp. NLF-5-8]